MAWSDPVENAYSIHFYHTDHLGSTRIVTNGDGDIFERTYYLPFGEIFKNGINTIYGENEKDGAALLKAIYAQDAALI